MEEIQANFEAARESKEDLERSLASLQKDYIGKEDHAKRKLVRAESQIEQLSPRQASQGGMQLAPHGDADPVSLFGKGIFVDCTLITVA